MTDNYPDYSGEIRGLQSSLRSLGSEIKNISRVLTEDIRVLKVGVRDHGKKIESLEEIVNILQSQLTKLMGNIDSSFRVLQGKMVDLIKETKGGHNNIVSSVGEVRKTSESGLKKVSTGVALVDILKAMSESKETATTIKRALDEVISRYEQSMLTVGEKKLEYDIHYEQISKGYKKQIDVIGEHIKEIRDKLDPIIDELKIDEDLVNLTSYIIEESQTKVIKNRSEALDKAFDSIDFEKIKRYNNLKLKLDRFINDDSLVKIESPLVSENATDVPSFGLPVVAVKISSDNEFYSSNEPSMKVFCLNSKSPDCYNMPVPDVEYAQLTNSIQSVCENLSTSGEILLDTERIEVIKDGLDSLTNEGLLQREHNELIKKHLDQYPLYWIDS